jgi:hypothetical protein
VARQCNLGNHEVRYEFLYLHNCLVDLMGRDLLCKLRAQIAFDLDVTAALKLRGPKAKTLILTVAQEEEWWPLRATIVSAIFTLCLPGPGQQK